MASSSASTPEAEALSEVIVTGTHLSISQAAAVSPVIVITREQIEKMGLSTAEDVVRSLPQNFSDFNAATVTNGGVNNIADQGESAANLRGLGSQYTLVLVNGHRRATSANFFGQNAGATDLSTIPMAAVDRIEIMTDGASAVYGSDAVGGVINFILKKHYQGGETHVRQEIGHNGGDSISVDQTVGDTWSSGDVTFAGRYARTNAVNNFRVGWTTANLKPMGGDDFRSTAIGQPGVVYASDGVTLLGSLPAADDGTHGIAGKLSPANIVPYDLPAYGEDLIPATRSLTFDLNAEQSLTDWAQLYGEVDFAKNTSLGRFGPLNLYRTVPATNTYNDTGGPVLVSYDFVRETQEGLIPPNISNSNQRSLGVVLGFKISLPKGWTLDISGNHQREYDHFAAMDFDPVLLAERLSGLDANGNPIPVSQQLNLFGNGTAQNPAALAGLARMGIIVPGGINNPDLYATTDSLQLTAQGTLLTLPGGSLQLAGGGEFRRESYNLPGLAGGTLTENPSRKVEAIYAETNVPLVGEGNRRAGVYEFNLYAADRWEQYPIIGHFNGLSAPEQEVKFSKDSPKVGFSWYPWSELKLRASYGKAFRAPGLSDLFGQTTPINPPVGVVDPEHPELGVIYPPEFTASNPHLGPETANEYTAGLDWWPDHELKGLNAKLTYDRIDFTNRIDNTGNYQGMNVFFTLPGAVVRNSSGQITQINYLPINIAARRSDSLDAQLDYNLDTRLGSFELGAAGTYTIKLADTLAPGTSAIALDGTWAGPERVKGRAFTSWSREDYGLNFVANYSSSYLNLNQGSPSGLPPQGVSHYTTFDLTGFYNLPRGVTINAGVRDLTNTQFPFMSLVTPWDARRVDLRGRTLYLEIVSRYGLLH